MGDQYSLRDLPDRPLALLVQAGDLAAREEVRRRFAPIATLLALKICARIAHRGNRCPGRRGLQSDCDLAFTWVERELLDHVAGHYRRQAAWQP